MGYEAITIAAGADMSAANFQFLAIALDDGLVAAAGGEAGGILQNRPKSGEHATLFYSGESEYRAGAAVVKGARLAPANSGWIITVASGGFSVGRALAAVASGGIGRGVFNFANGAVTGA